MPVASLVHSIFYYGDQVGILSERWQLQLTYPKKLWPTQFRLDDERERETFLDAVTETGSVQKACKLVGMHRATVYRYANKNAEFAKQFINARAMAAEQHYDECIVIADDEFLDPRDKHIRIETRMRVAGKLIQRLSDKPLAQINVDSRSVIITEDKRASLQDRLSKLLLKDSETEKE